MRRLTTRLCRVALAETPSPTTPFARYSQMFSSVIRAYAYDPAAHRLDVTFVTGRRYSYADVPPAVASALDRAASKGDFFNRRIRDRFAYVRAR